MPSPDVQVEFWIPDPLPTCSPRSRLYSPEPIGIGTAQVESLTSYMCRLAQSHCLTAGSMYLRKAGYSADSFIEHLTEYKNKYPHGRGLGNAHCLNGVGISAEEWVEALGRTTGRTNLALLTFIPLRGVVAGIHLLRKRLAWCPYCFAQDRWRGIAEHNRLIWSFRIMPCCLVHKTPLSERCPECKKTQSCLSSFSLPGYCAHCAKWMGRDQDPVDRQNPEYAIDGFAETFISRLLESYGNISSPNDFQTCFAQTLQVNLKQCIDHIAEGKPAWLAKAAGVDVKAVSNWRFGVGRAFPIGSLLKVASILGFSADALIASELDEEAIIKAGSTINIRSLVRARHQHKDAKLAHLIKESRSDERPSLQEVAERLGLKSCEHLRTIDPGLCRLISTRYAEKRKALHLPPRNTRKCSDDMIRERLERALAAAYPATILAIAHDLGYKQSARLYKTFPSLCDSIMKKRSDFEAESHNRNRKLLESAINGDSPLSLDEIRERVGEHAFHRILSSEQSLVSQLRAIEKENRKCEMRSALESALSETPPPSLCVVCERLGVDGKLPRSWFPDLSRAIISRANTYRSAEKARCLANMDAEVLDAVTKLRDAGITPMCKTILPMVSSASKLGFVEISRSIRRARRVLHLSTDSG